jgi:hypothetical protein
LGASKVWKKAVLRFKILRNLWLLHSASFITKNSFPQTINLHTANIATELWKSDRAIAEDARWPC